MENITLRRIYLLRACYLLLFIGLSFQVVPDLFGFDPDKPLMDGVVVAMLSALGLLSALGVYAPLKMIPLLVFEVVWKVLWALSVALPHWLRGSTDEAKVETLFACALAIPIFFIIPWRYTFRRLVSSTGPWHPERALQRGDD